MVKRCPPSDSGNSSEYELKPDISDDENDYEDEDIKSPKKKISPTKKPKKSLSKTPVSPPLTGESDPYVGPYEEGMDPC